MPTDFDVAQADRSFAARFFNDTWGYRDKTSRTEDETDAMIHCCHASFHHWSRLADATRTNIAVGYWQLAREEHIAAVRAAAENVKDEETLAILMGDIESVP